MNFCLIGCKHSFDSPLIIYFLFLTVEVVENTAAAMAATRTRTSSFSRNTSVAASPQAPGLKNGPSGTIFLSSGIPDLDSNPPSLLFHRHTCWHNCHCATILYVL